MLARVSRVARDSGLAESGLRSALEGYRRALELGLVKRAVLTVIDFSLPSHTRRLWVLDLATGRVLAHEYVAHGSGSGGDSARWFSNRDGSEASSLGTFVTASTYQGRNGLSLRLEGLDAGVNDRAGERGIVVHGADYVSEAMIRRLGRLGRSWGCPALSHEAADRLIPLMAQGSVIYAYYAPQVDARREPGPAASPATAPIPRRENYHSAHPGEYHAPRSGAERTRLTVNRRPKRLGDDALPARGGGTDARQEALSIGPISRP